MKIGSYDEINKITREIDEVALVLQKSFVELRDEKNKLNCILNNIGAGIFVVDERKDIIFINSAAVGIFNVTPDIIEKHMYYMTYDKTLTAAVIDCIEHEKNTEFKLDLDGEIYLVTVKQLPGTKLVMTELSKAAARTV